MSSQAAQATQTKNANSALVGAAAGTLAVFVAVAVVLHRTKRTANDEETAPLIGMDNTIITV